MSKTVLIIKNLSNNLKKYKCLSKFQSVKFYTFSITIIIAFSLLFCSCNLIFNSSPKDFEVTSYPEGVKVHIDSIYIGVTPLKLRKKSIYNSFKISIENPYTSATITETILPEEENLLLALDILYPIGYLASVVEDRPYSSFRDLHYELRNFKEQRNFDSKQIIPVNNVSISFLPLFLMNNVGMSYDLKLFTIFSDKLNANEFIVNTGLGYGMLSWFNGIHTTFGLGANIGIKDSYYNERCNSINQFFYMIGLSKFSSQDNLNRLLYMYKLQDNEVSANFYFKYNNIDLVNQLNWGINLGYNYGSLFLSANFGYNF